MPPLTKASAERKRRHDYSKPVNMNKRHIYAPLPPHADFIYKRAHGVDVPLRVFPAPSSTAHSGPRPWLLWFHGGGFFVGHHVAPYPWVLPAFHSRGYHVVSVGYRLAPHVSLAEILGDATDALAWCRANLARVLSDLVPAPLLNPITATVNTPNNGAPNHADVDIDTYIAGGDSAGGILALLGGHTFRPPPTAIVESCCVVDMHGYHPPEPAWFPLSGTYSDAALAAAVAERDPAKATVAAPYIVELAPPVGMGRLLRPVLDAAWGPSTLVTDGAGRNREAAPEYTPEESAFGVLRNDMQNYALRECKTLPIIHRREDLDSDQAYLAAIDALCPLARLGEPGTPAPADLVARARGGHAFPPTYVMHGTVDAGVPVSHARRLVARLKELGVPVQVTYGEEKNHAFDIWINGPGSVGWDEFVVPALRFLDVHVGNGKGRL